MVSITHFVAHYGEIALKAQNRGFFERLLARNIRAKLGAACKACRRESGQITIELSQGADMAAVRENVALIPGIAYFSPALAAPLDETAIRDAVLALAAESTFETFRIDAHRAHKQNAFRSMTLNRELGGVVLDAFPDKRVRLEQPDLTLKVELTEHAAYVSAERLDGVGGMPTQQRQKVVALISGGLDSPVAAYMLMKRGCEVILAHFQNENQMTGAVEDKIVRIAERLARCQLRTVLHIVPFAELQREIIARVPAALRMLMYRRVMLQMAARMARRARARFLVTGDSLSQVASQTYENLAATYADCPLPVLTPLIGLDKKEIVATARRIGTYDLSSLPYEDCCSFFLPKHPELRARAETLRELEAAMDIDDAIRRALESARVVTW